MIDFGPKQDVINRVAQAAQQAQHTAPQLVQRVQPA
jgi:hypothetical protein